MVCVLCAAGLITTHTQVAEQQEPLESTPLRADDQPTTDQLVWDQIGHGGIAYRPIPRAKSRPFQNAISIDLEDWWQSVFDHSLPVSDRFKPGTYAILDLLELCRVRATFFVLGNICVKAPDLIRQIHQAGHEIQTHGYDHTEVTLMTKESFKQDLQRAKGVLEDTIGQRISGYRAPKFSIAETNLWALDVLAQCGFEYDSSIVPMRIRTYGIDGWPSGEHCLRTSSGAELIEIPVATVRYLGRRFPLGGGGYFRLLPYGAIRMGLNKLRRRGTPAVIYMHPYEFDPEIMHGSGGVVPLRMRLHQGIGRRGFASKIRSLLDEFDFGPMGDLLPHDEHPDEPCNGRPH